MAGALHKVRNFWTVDSGGWRAILGALLRYCIIGASAALAKSLAHQPDGTYSFDYPLFGLIVGAWVFTNVASNLFDIAFKGGTLLQPVHGRVLSADRKAWTSAVLRKIALKLKTPPIDGDEARQIVSDILNCIVLHVRDARGSHSSTRVDVFASLLMEDGEDLVVVARDRWLNSPQHQRPILVRYTKGSMLAARAIASRRTLTIGDLCVEYPEAPTNKPYRSILVIPVIGADETSVLAVLSIDSSRPYFFQSFRRGAVENALENGLQPYLQTLVLALEGLISHDRTVILRTLTSATTLKIGGNPNAAS